MFKMVYTNVSNKNDLLVEMFPNISTAINEAAGLAKKWLADRAVSDTIRDGINRANARELVNHVVKNLSFAGVDVQEADAVQTEDGFLIYFRNDSGDDFTAMCLTES